MVLAYRRMADGSFAGILPDSARDGDSTLAGFESSRERFYGSDLAFRLNLKLLPELIGSDLWVYASELPELRRETLLLLHNLAPDELEYWSYRLGNIINAIERASVFGEDGVVYIG